MNKIFKVIWSKARNCYVVVSEIAHCQGKGKGQKRAVLTCSLAAALTVFTLTGGITAVQAAQTINITEESPGAQGSTNEGTYSTVIGPGAKNKSNQSEGIIVIGHNAIVGNNGSPKDSIAIGTSANVVGENNIAIGTKAAVTNNGGNNAISLGTEATAEKSESIAIGMKAHANNNDGIAAIAIGSGSEAQKDKSIAIGYKTLVGNNGESGGIAIGSSIVNSDGTIITQTTAAQGNDIAFGVGAQTNNRNMNGHNGGAIAIGHLSYSNGNQDVAIGDNAKTGRIDKEGEGYVAIGANSFSNIGPGVVGYDFKTNGSHNIQTNEDAAAWKSTNGAVSVGNVSDSDHTKWITRQITGVAAGSNNTDAVNVAQLKAAIDSVKPGGGSGTGGVHYYSVLSDETGDGSNYDNKGAKGKNSLAAGVSASATEKAENAVAIGYKAKAEGKGATVIGQYGTATGRYALAFGGQQTDTSSVAANNVASGDNSVAFGERSTASGSNSTAFGQETKATEKRATAFGQRTQATQSNATAFGIDTIASGQNATAFGNLTQATEIGATAFGNKNQATGQYATAWGGGDKVVTNNDGITKKVGTVASGTYATAFGERTVASGESATAFGSDSTAEGKNSLAFGEGSNALGGNSLAGLGGTAAADDSIALGRNAQARSKDTLAIGNGAKALTGKDVAIGYGAEASGNLTDTSTYNYPAIAIGDGTSVKASESVAIGKANVIERADGEADLAGANILGHNNTVKASGVAVIGNNNSVTDPRNHDVMILGNLVTKTTDNSVFLGSGSAYTSESESTKGKSKTYTSDRIGGATLTYAGGAVTSGIVSVGSPDATRRIQNVAPGLLTSASTDAVNGSQLYAVANVAAKNTEILGKGLKFKGDNDTVITKKLDEQLDIVGGADAKKLTDKNIGVNNVGGQLKIQLAKNIDLTKSGSVMIGDTTINNTGLTIQNGPSITKTHIDAGSKTIINVAPGKNGTDAVNVNQLNKVQNIASAHTTVSVGDRKAQKDGKEVKGGNLILTRTQDADTHAYNYDVKLGNDITVGEKGEPGKNGVDGKIGVNGKNGSSVVINGKDGSIGLTGPKGADGTPGASLTMKAENGRPGLNGKDGTTMTRIVYDKHEVATLDDGLKFAGDDGQTNGKKVIRKKLDEQLDIVGGADAKKLTDKNIGVNNVGGQLKIQLAKNIDLTKSGSVMIGDTTINNTGLTIQNGPSITKTHIDAGSKTIINVAPGKNGTDAVNVNQLNKVQNIASAHTTVSVGGRKAQKDGKEVKGGNLVLTRTQDAATHAYNYDVKLGNDITVGEKGADGKDGKISVNGKDGSSVVINGKDGTIGLNGKNGTNGLTIRGAAGKDGITRIVYKDAAGKDHPVATLDDGLKFKGDTGDVISKKLNDTLTIKGGQTDASKLSDGKNVGVINEKGALRIELAKKIDLGEDGSVKMGDTTINNNGLTIKNGPTITKTNVSMNNQQIHNVAAGKKGTDAVNVDQLNEVQTLASKHTKVTVEGGTAPKGQTYVGKNLKINVTNSNGQETYDLKLADNLSIGEKGADGKDGKIGVNGKDGSSVVINGKDGTIGLNGKNGTNGLTIRGAAGKPGVDGKDGITRIVYKDAAGKDHPVATLEDGLNFKGDDRTVISKKLNQRMDIVGGANENNLSENNIGVISDNGKLHVKLAKDLKGLTSVTTTDGNGNTTVQNGKGVTVKDSQNNTSIFTAKDITFTNRDKSHKTKLDEDGLIIFTKGTSGQANQTIKITNTYISMGGQQIHNVLAGKADTDAVNVSQLKAVQSVAEAHSTVSVGGKKAGKDSVDVKGGNLVLKRTENTNGSKNYDVKLADDISIKSVKTTDDKGNKTVQKGGGITTIDKDGNKTSVTGKGVTTVDKDGNKTSLTGKGMTTVDKDGNKTSVTGKGVSISGKDGNKTTITEKGLTIKDGPVVTKDKFSAGGQQIHDVEAGTAPKDAVNVSQLKDEIGKVEQHHTEVTVNGGTEAKEGTYNPSGNLQIKKTTDKDTGKKTYDLKLADNLTFGAKDGSDGKEGVDGSIGVNGRNGSAVVINGQDGSIGLNGANGENGLTIKGANGTVGVDGQAGTTRLIYETKDGEKTVKHEVATMDDGMKYSGDSGNAAVKLNKNVRIYGGATEYADGNNIGVVASQDGDNAKLQVKLAKDLKGINSIEAKTITTGDTTMDNSGLTVKGDDNHKDITIHQGNVNMGGNKVSGVADGKVSKDSTDAVNGSQLWQRDQAINSLGGAVNKLDSRVNRVGAGAAALAALHPLDFDPDDKWDFAAGYGNYRGANAAAVGAYYRPNEDTMFSVGGSFGGGENMVNAGVSIKLGQGNHVSTSRVAMAKEIKDLRQNVANLNAIVNRQSALIDKLTGTNAGMIKDKGNDLFPDVPANHWAYEYVTKLKHAGILTGYPDGNFDGDRMMTRYEFAAIVYRAIMAGAASNPALNQDGTLDKLANEFSSEMKYIRIDKIQKDRDGKPTIERVRVISDAK